MKLLRILLIITLSTSMWIDVLSQEEKAQKKIYMTYILHGNMNYDRYVRPTIWLDFPVIYDNLLDFMEEHPDFKGQLQFSGQTFNSLKQTAPQVIEHAIKLHNNGQFNFTGTSYSEPVNIYMDGETNYRCVKLGTSIIEDAFGFTDGFYTQERAYTAQLPWILNNSNVSWVPVITDDNTCAPFYLKGIDGSVTVGVPNFSLYGDKIYEEIEKAPNNSLFLIEGDYEIPDGFVREYEKVKEFSHNNKNIDIEWITVKEYIEKFGVSEEKYVDHSAKAKYITHGTYSRWTADPLDIIVQDYTNQAMDDFRAAMIVDALTGYLYNQKIDEPFSKSNLTLKYDPVAWNIAHADTYPDVEPTYLARDGKVTVKSKAEHLLLWAVNSDSRGWYPLFEKRRERINSFENSSALSHEIINRGLDVIAQQIHVEGYNRYYIAFNSGPEQEKLIKLETEQPYNFYDYTRGLELESTTIFKGKGCHSEFKIKLPAYGYKIIGLKQTSEVEKYTWLKGKTVENGNLKLTAYENKVLLEGYGNSIELSLDSFRIRALAQMDVGKGDNEWRDAKPYGKARISTRRTIYPQLRIEKQIDWLIHIQQTFTLLPDRVLCDIDFVFPHPTLVNHKEGEPGKINFDPRGLVLHFESGQPGNVYYDIPFGISPHKMDKLSYFCALSTGILQHDLNGFMVVAGTGEQAFQTNPAEGEMDLFLGASTTSGPISNVGMEFVSKTNVVHELDWYAEPFHGTYNHRLMIFPFKGTWQENHAPAVAKSFTRDVYFREFYPTEKSGNLPAEGSLISVNQPGVEITSMEYSNRRLSLRLNDKEGKDCDLQLEVSNETKKIQIPKNGIINVEF